MDRERIIFEDGEERPITKAEYDRLDSEYEQHKSLLKSLAAWSAKALADLKPLGYGTENVSDPGKWIFIESAPNSDWDGENESDRHVPIYTFYATIPLDATIIERAALEVLKTISDLYKALFESDKIRIANLGIKLGLAVSKAHATPFEKLAVSGEKVHNGPRSRGNQQSKDAFQDYVMRNPDIVKHVTKKKDLFDIPELQQFIRKSFQRKAWTYYSHDTVGGWFSEVYPGQIRGGAPKIT